MAAGTDIFISYKREERALAETYATAFRKQGFLVVTDLNIPAATQFDDAIDTMIREATLVVALWTSASAGSNHVRNEAIEAFKQDKYLGVIAKPLDSESLPLSLRHNQFIDVSPHPQAKAVAIVSRDVAARVREKRAEAKKIATQDDELAEDMAFYANVRSIGELSGYQTYLRRYPTGIYVEEARGEIARINHWTNRVGRTIGSPYALFGTLFGGVAAIAALYPIVSTSVEERTQARIEALEADNSTLEAAKQSLEASNKTLEQERDDALAAVDEPQSTELAGIQAENASLVQQLADKQKELDDALVAYADENALRSAVDFDLEKLTKERDALQSDLDAAEKRATNLSRELATETSARSDLAAKLSEAQGEAKRLQDERDALAASVTPVARPETGTAGTDDLSIAERRAKALREFGCKNNTGVMVLDECRPLDTKELYLEDTDITDLTPLAALTELETLFLWNTQVSDLRALEGMRGLQVLRLDNTQVSDLRALEGLSGLQALNLRNTQVSDLSPLTELKSLGRIYLLGTNSLSDLGPLLQLGTMHRIQLPDGTHAGDWQKDTPENRAAVQEAIRNWKP